MCGLRTGQSSRNSANCGSSGRLETDGFEGDSVQFPVQSVSGPSGDESLTGVCSGTCGTSWGVSPSALSPLGGGLLV
jgi:hypothetical protein